jgi:uncharacterized membrane protein
MIVVAAFLTGTGFDFNSHALDNTTLLVLFLAGLFVALLCVLGKPALAAYAAGAATTIALIWVIDLVKSDADFTVQLVVLIIGVLLALMATISNRRVRN